MDLNLHPNQADIFHDPARFKVVAAGRRFGKTWLAVAMLFVEAWKDQNGSGYSLGLEEVYYVAPFFTQGKALVWPVLLAMGADLIANKSEKDGRVTLKNGRRISIKGADEPDNLRGVGLSFCVMDEYAFMKPMVWQEIIRPMLMRAEGGALFIGTPAGKNHFYNLWAEAKSGKLGPEWKAWKFHSYHNPTIPKKEIDAALADITNEETRRQELFASFEGLGGAVFTRAMFPVTELDEEIWGEYVLAIDLAGYATGAKAEDKRKIEILDNHAMCVAKIHEDGWHIEEIEYGKWGVKETALRILDLWGKYRPTLVGAEKGALLNALMPYLKELQLDYGFHFEMLPLEHGNRHKPDRIRSALQGRAESGRITLAPDDKDEPWHELFYQQLVDFPSKLTKDDLIDALAYVDQLAQPSLNYDPVVSNWHPTDSLAGY
jgi:hypothetical protein